MSTNVVSSSAKDVSVMVDKTLTELQEQLLSIVKDHPAGIQAFQLAKKLDITVESVGRQIKVIRRRVMQGMKIPYIYISANGYTCLETKENVLYEARYRINHGIAIIRNGMYVFAKCRKLSPSAFNELKVMYRPRLEKLTDELK